MSLILQLTYNTNYVCIEIMTLTIQLNTCPYTSNTVKVQSNVAENVE